MHGSRSFARSRLANSIESTSQPFWGRVARTGATTEAGGGVANGGVVAVGASPAAEETAVTPGDRYEDGEFKLQ